MKKIKALTMGAAAMLLCGPTPGASALSNEELKTGRHTLGSARDVWRVELRTLERFLAMSTGDGSGAGELRTVKISLQGLDDQYHVVAESSPMLGPTPRTNRVPHYLEINRGSQIFLQRLDEDNLDTYNLWIHVKQRGQGDVGRPTVNFKIQVYGRELDCKGNNICRRGNSGTITYYVNLEIPTVRSNRCVPANSYNITAVNGQTMVLRPQDGTGNRDTRNVRHRNSNNKGPHLAMQTGEICIASTAP